MVSRLPRDVRYCSGKRKGNVLMSYVHFKDMLPVPALIDEGRTCSNSCPGPAREIDVILPFGNFLVTVMIHIACSAH